MDVEVAVVAVAKPRKTNMLWYAFLLVVCTLIWSSQPTAVKFVGDQLGPIALTFLPFYLTTALLVPLLVWRRRANPQAARPTTADWYKFAIAGIGGQIVAQFGGVWGVTRSTAQNAAVLMLLIPVVTAVLASIMLRERLTLLRVICLLVGLVGVMLMSIQDLAHTSFLRSGYFAGNALLFASCAGSAFYNVYCKGLLARFAEVEILIFSYITASLASVAVMCWVEPDCLVRLAHVNRQGWAALVFLAVFHYGVSMLLLFYVLQYLPVTVASASIYLCPVFGVLIARIFLGEHLNAWQQAGALAVLVPTAIIMKYDSGSQ